MVTLYNSLIPIFDGQATPSASPLHVVGAPGGCPAVVHDSDSKDGGRDAEAESDTLAAQRDPAAASSSSPSAGGSVSKPNAQALAAMTFSEWFAYWLSAPEFATSRRYLYSDHQYMLLLASCSANKVGDMDINGADRKWLYNKRLRIQYRRVDMIYKDSNGNAKVGPVVVCWPYRAQQRRGFDKRGDGKASDNAGDAELSPDSMLRCVPVSQIEMVLNLVHIGRTGHRGQNATDIEIQRVYDGITRDLVREYVARCGICQTRQKKKYKAALRPIISKQLGERHQVDLIDLHNEADGDFKYIMHVTDHWSRFRWGFALIAKTAEQVAYYLRIVWMIHGAPRTLQCDNGGEFRGEVTDACRDFRVQLINSAPYHPQSQGQVEKLNGVVKNMLRKWQEQEQIRGWARAVPLIFLQIFLQMNTTVCSAIRTTPYELVFGTRFRQDMNAIGDPLFLAALMGDLNNVNSTRQLELSAAEDLTQLAAGAELQRLPSVPTAMDMTGAQNLPDVSEPGVGSDVGGRESRTGGRESETGGREG
jgi:hypothetical protein